MLKKKVKMALNRRPPFPLPEVSSAPSWFEFSSFLLTFAAEADIFLKQAVVAWGRPEEKAGKKFADRF